MSDEVRRVGKSTNQRSVSREAVLDSREINRGQVRSMQEKTRQRTKWVAKTGILSAVAIILMYLEFSIPLMPVFLKFDFAEVPALLGAFAMGPWTGLIIELIKNLSHLPFSQTAFIGELSNFVICGGFVFVAGLIYQKHKSKRGAIISLAAGGLTMVIFGVLFNYFINLPFYARVMGLEIEAIVGMSQSVGNTLVKDMKTLLAFVFVPFNIFKSIVISLIVMLMYKRISPLLHK